MIYDNERGMDSGMETGCDRTRVMTYDFTIPGRIQHFHMKSVGGIEYDIMVMQHDT